MKYHVFSTIGIVFITGLSGCYKVGHEDYINYNNDQIGEKMPFKKPFKFENSGKLVRGKIAISGQGLTHIEKDNNGNLIYHFSEQEILPHYHTKEWVGKCLTYTVVDPETYIIKGWGFDGGGNPLSCRSWP
ncbi:MAG: hypothetical protein ABW168_11610 [Sedimenticola sp.]